MVFRKFEEMEVWQDGRKMVADIYAHASSGGLAKDFGMKDQMQRAAVSICSNVAEGYARRGNKELVKFLWIAKGSAAEVQSQLYNALGVGYITKQVFDSLYSDLNKIQSKLYRLIQSLSTDANRKKI